MHVTFRRLERRDLPTLARWLEAPHVHRWWHHETTPEALERDFGPVLRGEEPAEDLVAVVDGCDVGLVQRSRWHDYPDEVAEIAPFVDLPAGAVIGTSAVRRSAQIRQGIPSLYGESLKRWIQVV